MVEVEYTYVYTVYIYKSVDESPPLSFNTNYVNCPICKGIIRYSNTATYGLDFINF